LERKEVTGMDGRSHLDREIVRLIDAVAEEQSYFQNEGYSLLNIKTGVAVIGGVQIDFAEQTLLDGQLAMILPADLQSVPPEQHFKPEFRPDLLLTDAEGAIQITITHSQRKAIDADDVIAHKNEVKQVLQTLNLTLESLEEGSKEICNRQLVFLEFVTSMSGTNVYNLRFFIELNQRVLTGGFVCIDKKSKGWKPVFHQILDSLKVFDLDDKAAIRERPDYSQYHFTEGHYAVYHDREYRLFKVGADSYRLVSTSPQAQEDGFVPQEGVFKKTVKPHEISTAHRLKLTLTYRGCQFGVGQVLKNQVELVTKNCDAQSAKKLQLEISTPNEYSKWVDKTEIENVIETKLPAKGFPMPE
jgi:hypothetical protein